MESLSLIQWCLEHLNYWTITLLMAIESSVVPLPSELVVPPAAYMAASGASGLNVVLVVAFATLGADLGSLVNYLLARWLGRPIFYGFANSRLGHMLLLTAEKVERAERYFNDHGTVGILLGRLVPGVRHLISIPAGLARMRLSHFLLYTTLGAGLWNVILAAFGYALQSVVPEEELTAKVTEYSHELGLVMLGVAACVVAFLVYKGWKK